MTKIDMDTHDDVIGYLAGPIMLCSYCVQELSPNEPRTVRVYESNIRPYSQTCHSCNRMLVDGAKKSGTSDPLELFERPEGWAFCFAHSGWTKSSVFNACPAEHSTHFPTCEECIKTTPWYHVDWDNDREALKRLVMYDLDAANAPVIRYSQVKRDIMHRYGITEREFVSLYMAWRGNAK